VANRLKVTHLGQHWGQSVMSTIVLFFHYLLLAEVAYFHDVLDVHFFEYVYNNRYCIVLLLCCLLLGRITVLRT